MRKFILPILALSSVFFYACDGAPKEVSEEVIEETVEETVDKILDPVKWEYSTEKLGENEYKITFEATIDDDWYVYSNNIAEDGPIPTDTYFDENEFLGEVSEMEESGEVTKDGYDEMFDMNIKKFGHAATFSQVVRTTGATTITGYLEFMTCDAVQCLFPDPIEFTIDAN